MKISGDAGHKLSVAPNMTLDSRKVFSALHPTISLIIALSLVSYSPAQTPNQHLRRQQPPQQTEEEKKAAKELEKKAVALVDELVAEAASLRLAENRVYVLTIAADALWKHDEERARALIREAMDQAIASMREARDRAAQEDGQYFDPRYARQTDGSYLRGVVMNSLAARDPRLALEFLQTARSLRPTDRQNPGEEYQERELQLRLAAQIAENDPQTALRIAEEHLLDGKSQYQIVNIWNALQRKDPKAASALTDRMISHLKSQDVLGDYEALNFVFVVLNNLKSRIQEIANAQKDPNAANNIQLNSAEIERAYREALEVAAAAALKITVNNLINPQEADRARNLLAQIQGFLLKIR